MSGLKNFELKNLEIMDFDINSTLNRNNSK